MIISRRFVTTSCCSRYTHWTDSRQISIVFVKKNKRKCHVHLSYSTPYNCYSTISYAHLITHTLINAYQTADIIILQIFLLDLLVVFIFYRAYIEIYKGAYYEETSRSTPGLLRFRRDISYDFANNLLSTLTHKTFYRILYYLLADGRTRAFTLSRHALFC